MVPAVAPRPSARRLACSAALALVLTACGVEPPPPMPAPAPTGTTSAIAPSARAPQFPAVPPAGTPEPSEAPRRRAWPRAGVSPDPRPPQGPVPAPPAAGSLLLPAVCCSEPRGGRQLDAIVIHTTELEDRRGTGDLLRLATFFSRAGRSAHVANDADGLSARMVPDGRFAFHSTYWNVSTVGLEQMGFSAFQPADWRQRAVQLESSARWIAHWAGRHRVPIRRCEVTGLRYNRTDRVVAGTIVKRGVCSHGQLDPRNRHDPGAAYPWDAVLRRARAIVAQAG